MSSAKRNYYDALELDRAADAKAIKRAYHRLAARYHPDHNDSPQAVIRFKEITAAFAVLSDPARRQRYDERLAARERNAGVSSDNIAAEPAPDAREANASWMFGRSRLVGLGRALQFVPHAIIGAIALLVLLLAGVLAMRYLSNNGKGELAAERLVPISAEATTEESYTQFQPLAVNPPNKTAIVNETSAESDRPHAEPATSDIMPTATQPASRGVEVETPSAILRDETSSGISFDLAKLFPPPADDRRRLIPAEARRRELQQRIAEVYELATIPAGERRRALALELLTTARTTTDDDAAQYMLLNTARELAVGEGDLALAMLSIGELESLYQVDGDALRARDLAAASDAVPMGEPRRVFVDAGVTLVDRLMVDQRFDLATDACDALLRIAERPRDQQQLREIHELQSRATALEIARAAAHEALADLRTNPHDGAAALNLGTYVALGCGDWQRGLPLLAASDSETLRELAQRELSPPAQPKLMKQLADDWHSFAASVADPFGRAAIARAAMWYADAAPGLSGLLKVEAEKRARLAGIDIKLGGRPYVAGEALETAALAVAVNVEQPQQLQPAAPAPDENPEIQQIVANYTKGYRHGQRVDVLAKMQQETLPAEGNPAARNWSRSNVIRLPISMPPEYVLTIALSCQTDKYPTLLRVPWNERYVLIDGAINYSESGSPEPVTTTCIVTRRRLVALRNEVKTHDERFDGELSLNFSQKPPALDAGLHVRPLIHAIWFEPLEPK